MMGRIGWARRKKWLSVANTIGGWMAILLYAYLRTIYKE